MRARAHNRELICLTALTCAAIAYKSHASGPPTAQPGSPTCSLQLAAQPLKTTLEEIAHQCGVQIIYFSEVAEGLSAPELQGSYSVDDALHRLLDPAGLSFNHLNAETIEIRSTERKNASPGSSTVAHATSDAAQRGGKLAPSAREPVAEVIVNGTAEGLVATRTETPLENIPQTISLISSEQMRQQNNFKVEDALADAVGITVVQLDSVNMEYEARGFPIVNYTLDGGASLHAPQQAAGVGIGLFFQVPDLSEFDHIEVLRGSDALFGANGTPAGTLNLVRKRPLDSGQLLLSSSAGSWNNYREEVDVTGPLGLEGALRGRLDATYAHRDYFYNGAESGTKSIFAVLEYDLTPLTTLTLGGSYRWEDSRPFEGGLPQFSDGTDAHLPRSTAFTFDWSKFNTRTSEAYLRIEQELLDSWRVQLNVTSLRGSVEFAYARFIGPLDSMTLGLPTAPSGQFTPAPGTHNQSTFEITVTGAEQLFGHRLDIAFGGDFTHTTSSLQTAPAGPVGAGLQNIYDFDPAAYPDPIVATTPALILGNQFSELQSGLFASFKLQLAAPWSIVAGVRVSNDRTTVTDSSVIANQTYGSSFEFDYVGKLTPFAATLFRLNDTYSLYASYADIYQANEGFASAAGKLLPPLDGIDIEGGLKGVWRDGRLHGALTVYKILQRGSAVPDFDVPLEALSNTCCYLRGATNTSRGVDLELTGSIASGWLIGTGYSYNSNRHAAAAGFSSTDLSASTPRHLLKSWTSYQLPGRWQQWSVGGSLQAQSHIDRTSYGCPNDPGCLLGVKFIVSSQKSYAIVNPRIGYRIDDHWQLALTVGNLFDKHYYQTIGNPQNGSWYGAPRNFLVRMDARF